MKRTPRPRKRAVAWQKELRAGLSRILRIDDLLSRKSAIPLEPEVLSCERRGEYSLEEVRIGTTIDRRMEITLTRPVSAETSSPAVVCIHGHGGNRRMVHHPDSIYRGFAAALAGRGYVTVSVDVGQHEVYESSRVLMGERLWDLIRCVDYLESLPEVDESRIGCAGLSLGGEMAMWLGAMDERLTATVSSGFLTVMDHMESDHCMCWKFEGLRELADFPDVYSLIAPRALLCQNGLKEDPTQFYVPIARKAMMEIKVIYEDLGQPDMATLHVHEEGHVMDLPSLLAFFEEHLGRVAGESRQQAGMEADQLPGGSATDG